MFKDQIFKKVKNWAKNKFIKIKSKFRMYNLIIFDHAINLMLSHKIRGYKTYNY